ncbi:hypothetical protein F3Y22_tig00110121pilonHSYRG00058 [Hibiscus syriacus]|uniref:Uncharacterized protein n=1 Tax=Hibiscus syriacus TaxID=106335 RepID=A0A6A3BH25_HIBSY|nr:hypothetical protein F3Y22_tig00110121pilonHSYRG00058 [Hibiscus syriacus]
MKKEASFNRLGLTIVSMRNSASHSVMMEIEPNKPAGNGMVVGGLSSLSETLWPEKTNTEFVGDVSARLTLKDLTVMVSLSNGTTQKVLEGHTGYAVPGTLTASWDLQAREVNTS